MSAQVLGTSIQPASIYPTCAHTSTALAEVPANPKDCQEIVLIQTYLQDSLRHFFVMSLNKYILFWTFLMTYCMFIYNLTF